MSNLAAGIARAQEALHAGRSARIVQRARLRPARDEDAAQMRFALEDALNTADFADCGRLIVVRRLHLRALPPRAGPAVVARALEIAWQALSARAVAALHPQADVAPAVYFESRFEARLAWLKRVAVGSDVSAWYWAAALPEVAVVQAARSVQVATEVVIDALLQESAAHMVEALQAWPDAAVLPLARLVPQAVSRRLLEAVAPAAFASEPGDASQAAAEPAISPVVAEVAQRLSAEPLLPEAALLWVVALRIAPHVPAAQLAAQVRAVAAQWHRGMNDSARNPAPVKLTTVSASPSAAAEPPSLGAGNSAAANADPTSAPTPSAAANGSTAAAPPVWRMESGLQGSERAPPRAAPQPARDTQALPWLADAQATEHGGLLCLLNLLRALGFEAWLAQQPAAVRRPFVHALLTHLLDACGAAPSDPQRAWLALSPAEADALSATTFIDGNARRSPQRALRAWHLRLRRALRRHAALDLPAVVQRPAWMAATATHIDAVFPLDEVDLRLRRHGLDSDPGWVPWFGRIVAFHFVAAQRLPQPSRDRHG